jgi:hypothetical protein
MGDVNYHRKSRIIEAYGKEIPADNTVRLNRDGSPIFSWPDRKPYKPQPFPASPPGGWKITGVAIETGHLAPMAILTNACQQVRVWRLSDDGRSYVEPLDQYTTDGHYWIHFSDLDFTWGCIRVIKESDLRWLAAKVIEELAEIKAIDAKQAVIYMDVEEDT